ncbi:uncharacterized protein [Salvelinus sp. IW2-2015]|uniref:uncharacterized protein n=1 Tax=Salvelinus sp. IW2-2015 TaxID=2691554 RepID=UPI000CDF73F6|nr:uncharacterized protein LOC111965310 [Salvelinus alpinus]
MVPSRLKARSPMLEAVLGFVLGVVGGCVLGATEEPVNEAMSVMTSGALLKHVSDGVQTVGPLGLGTLLGATALTTVMTSVVAGVIFAAAMASVLLGARTSGGGASQAESVVVWIAVGLAGAFGTTASGATLGVIIEAVVVGSGLVGLLWALSIFTLLKPALHFLLKFIWRQGESCVRLGQSSLEARERELREMEAREVKKRDRVTVEIEQMIVTLDKEGQRTEGLEHRANWEAQRRERNEMERKRREWMEEVNEQRTIQEQINKVVVKYMDFLAFSGIPMTMTAMVTAGFGVFGFGDYRFVFVVLLALVLFMSFMFMKSSNFYFWMFAGCMGMFATFAIAVLTVHAHQEVVSESIKMRRVGQNISKGNISTQMNHRSSLEALGAGFFVSKLCQLGLGATIGGPLGRGEDKGKVIVGSAGLAVLNLIVVRVSSPVVLGAGGTSGALLGVVGAAGMSVGATASVAVGWSTWAGTIGTTAGMVLGALGMGKWHFVNIGLQMPVAYIFSMTDLF